MCTEEVEEFHAQLYPAHIQQHKQYFKAEKFRQWIRLELFLSDEFSKPEVLELEVGRSPQNNPNMKHSVNNDKFTIQGRKILVSRTDGSVQMNSDSGLFQRFQNSKTA